jgi:hypothetical protein
LISAIAPAQSKPTLTCGAPAPIKDCNYMKYIMFNQKHQIADSSSTGQHLDLQYFCATHQTNNGLFKKMLDMQSVGCRIQIVAVQYFSGKEDLHPRLLEPFDNLFLEI